MAVVEESTVSWYVVFMRLRNRGAIPSVTPTEYMPSHSALADFFGPKSGRGYIFCDQGLPAYGVYVRQLFPRVLQLPWPTSGLLPFHFARGLVVEALGVEVNWADFAFRATHPHQSKSTVPRILPEYRALSDPLPALPLIMPRAHLSVNSPLATALARHLNAEGGSSTGMELSRPEKMDLDDFENLPIDDAPEVQLAPVGAEITNSESTPKNEAPAVPRPPGPNGDDHHAPHSGTLDAAQMSALALLRPSFNNSIQNERVRLAMVKRDLLKSVDRVQKCLTEQRQRLSVLERKVMEKTRSHERSAAQFRRAREVMNANKLDQVDPITKGVGSGQKGGVRMCEQFVNSMMDTVREASAELESWESKLERQKERVATTTGELAAAEEMMTEKVEVLDTSLAQLQALGGFLASLR